MEEKSQSVNGYAYRVPISRLTAHLALTAPGFTRAVCLIIISLLISLALGLLIDIRYLMVCAMIIFLIIPMAGAMLYIVYGMLPLTALNVSVHTITLCEDRLKIDILSHPPTEGRGNTSAEEPDTDSDDSTPQVEVWRSVEVELRDLESVKYADGGCWLEFNFKGKRNYLFVADETGLTDSLLSLRHIHTN